MAVMFYGMSMYGIMGAIAAADNGADAYIMEPGYWAAYEWGSGLGRIDREATFSTQPKISLRTGILERFLLRFGDLAGHNPPGTKPEDRREHLFPTMEAIQQVVYEELAKYTERKVVDKVERGQITWRLNAPLQAVTKTRAGDAIVSITCGGQVYSCLNYVDCTPELDLAIAAGVTTRLGRESRELSGEVTAGNRLETPSTALAYNPTTGQRVKPLECAPRQTYHDGDSRTMAFNQRIIITEDAGRIPWADLELPWYKASDYDVDFALAFAQSIATLPGTPSPDPMLPIGAYKEYDMNNGGGTVIGSNWIGRLFDWHYATHEGRRYLHALYTQQKAGLFKDICSNPRWLTIPRKITRDKDGNVVSDTQIVEETKKTGLVPGRFTFPAHTAGEVVGLGTRKYNKPYIYEVNWVTDDDGFVFTPTTVMPPAWKPSTVYKVGERCVTSTGRYQVASITAPATSAASGNGPTGKGTGIVDGTVTWSYAGALVPTAPCTTAPTGTGTAIADGTRLRWKMYLPFVPGMSPHVYVRESFRIVGQFDLDFDHCQPPEHEVPEAICAYAYPHMDGHLVQRFAAANGVVTHEGNDDLEGANAPVAQLMPWGATKPLPGECRNLAVVCGVSSTRLGWIPTRVEFAYIKIANGLAIIAAVADRLQVYSDDVDYETQAKPALILGEMYTALPKAA